MDIPFVDDAAIRALEASQSRDLPRRAIAVCEGTFHEAVECLVAHPWLSNIVSASARAHPLAHHLVDNAVAMLADDRPGHSFDLVRAGLTGRRHRIRRASDCAERIDRAREALTSATAAATVIEPLCELATRLLDNAFYEAPVAAGVTGDSLERHVDIELPADTTCELTYGCSEELAIVRVRDPFGALSRTRFLAWLREPAQQGTLATVSLVVASIVHHHHSDVLIGFSRSATPPVPFALHLFFRTSAQRRIWKSDESGDPSHPTFVTTTGP